MYRELPTGNRLLHRRLVERNQRLHRIRLRNMACSIDNKPPPKHVHLRQKLKKMQLEEERYATIERENRILLEKMSRIMQTNYLENHSNAKLKSLNKDIRKRELMRITQENQAILRRIQHKEPHYNHLEWEENFKKQEDYLKNICQYPYRQWKEKGKDGAEEDSFLIEQQNQQMGSDFPDYPSPEAAAKGAKGGASADELLDKQVGEDLLSQLRQQERRIREKKKEDKDDGVSVVFVLGLPGSGKTTLCQRIAEEFEYKHLCVSEMVRDEVKKGSPEGKQIHKAIVTGSVIPGSLTMNLVRKAISKDGGLKYIVEGFPRTVEQAHEFEKIKGCHFTLFLECEDQVGLERLKELSIQNGEDPEVFELQEENIRHRIRLFKETSAKTVKYLEKLSKLHTIDASLGAPDVFKAAREVFMKLTEEKKTGPRPSFFRDENAIAEGVVRVTAAHSGHVAGLRGDRTLMLLEDNKWCPIPLGGSPSVECIDVSVAPDGTLVALDTQGMPMTMSLTDPDGGQLKKAGEQPFLSITAGGKDLVFAVDADGAVHQFAEGAWEPYAVEPPAPVEQISAGRDGALWAIKKPAEEANSFVVDLEVVVGDAEPTAGFTRLEESLNTGTAGTELFLCVRRSANKAAALTDIKVIYKDEGEAVPQGYTALAANVNQGNEGAEEGAYQSVTICFTRQGAGAVSDVQICMPDDGKECPEGFTMVERDLNAGLGANGTLNIAFSIAVEGEGEPEPLLMRKLADESAAWEEMEEPLVHVNSGGANQTVGLTADGEIMRWKSGGWSLVDGMALGHVEVGCNGGLWGVNSGGEAYRYAIAPAATKGAGKLVFARIQGSLRQLGVGHCGVVAGVNQKDELFVFEEEGWYRVPGKYLHVTAAHDGSVFALSSTGVVHQLDAKQTSMTEIETPCRLLQINASRADNIIGVDKKGDVYLFNGATWEQLDAPKLKQVSTDHTGAVWAVTRNQEIFTFNQKTGVWTQIEGKLVQVDAAGRFVVGISARGEVYHWTGSSWSKLQGSLRYIAVGTDGSLWGTNIRNEVYKIDRSLVGITPKGMRHDMAGARRKDGELTGRSHRSGKSSPRQKRQGPKGEANVSPPEVNDLINHMAAIQARVECVGFVLGPPGIGKTTLCEQLVQQCGYVHLQTRELIREEIRKGTPEGQTVLKVVKAQAAVPDTTVVEIILNGMQNSEGTKFVIEGFPRSAEQAEVFEKIRGVDFAICLDSSSPEAQSRMRPASTGSGEEINTKVYERRVELYNTSVKGAVDVLTSTEKMSVIDAGVSAEDVFESARDIVSAKEIEAKDREAIMPVIDTSKAEPAAAASAKSSPKKSARSKGGQSARSNKDAAASPKTSARSAKSSKSAAAAPPAEEEKEEEKAAAEEQEAGEPEPEPEKQANADEAPAADQDAAAALDVVPAHRFMPIVFRAMSGAIDHAKELVEAADEDNYAAAQSEIIDVTRAAKVMHAMLGADGEKNLRAAGVDMGGVPEVTMAPITRIQDCLDDLGSLAEAWAGWLAEYEPALAKAVEMGEDAWAALPDQAVHDFVLAPMIATGDMDWFATNCVNELRDDREAASTLASAIMSATTPGEYAAIRAACAGKPELAMVAGGDGRLASPEPPAAEAAEESQGADAE